VRERDFQIKFKGWIAENQKYLSTSTAYELKIEKSRSMRFDKVAKHQLRALYNAKHKYLYWKLPDVGYIQKPFDCMTMCNAKAYVVIWFYKPRQPKEMLFIEVDDFISAKWKNRNQRKSLKEEEWKKIATYKFHFK
jgi:hypothetical protein